MSIKFLTTSDQNGFSQLLDTDSELKQLFLLFMTQLEINSDFDQVMVGVTDEGLKVQIEDSPLLVDFNEQDQMITLYRTREQESGLDDAEELQSWDFDEDAIEEAVDFISSQIFEDEQEIDEEPTVNIWDSYD